ncbi:unnamed protein product [Cladocopium goreaui]|uniref:Uncharacterized protein n=1 Tax=Cladocopium goreaui TaxID=2562237 RepID=A0A9P1GP06_9DINO|nr:unnamed protein product [Cladocopium goreaui]
MQELEARAAAQARDDEIANSETQPGILETDNVAEAPQKPAPEPVLPGKAETEAGTCPEKEVEPGTDMDTRSAGLNQKKKKARRPLSRRELLQNAAKMRIRRMIAPKKKRSDLQVPAMVKEQWDKGREEKNEMAQLLMDTNWCKDLFLTQLELVIKKKLKVKITRNEGWFSESELRMELKWTPGRIAGVKKVCEQSPDTHIRSNRYDGVLEYWVIVKEAAEHTESLTQEEIHRQKKKVDDSAMPKMDQAGFQKLEDQKRRDDASAEAKGPDRVAAEVEQRAVLKRFIDSLLSKMNKLRTLIRDLKTNYSDDPTVPIKSLEDNLGNMDAQYEMLNEHWAVGEHLDEKASKTWWAQAEKKMKETSVVSSRALAAELKARSGKKFFQKTKPETNLETGEPHPEPKRKAADVPKGSKPAKKAKKSKK